MIKLGKLAAFGSAILLLYGCGGSGSTGNQEPVDISGAVQKGPFVIGSTVTVNELSSAGAATNATLTTQTTDDLGNFSFSYVKNTLLQINSNGYYRNEITGELSSGTLNLSSIIQTTDAESQSAHVNILTHLISNRVLKLISEGSSHEGSIYSATQELIFILDEIVTSPSIDSFSSLSLYSEETNGEGNAYLAVISALFYQLSLNLADKNETNPDAELTLILNSLSSDISDGTIDDESIINSLKGVIASINPHSVKENLFNIASLAGSSSEPANIDLFLDSDLDGTYNEYDLDDDGDDIPDTEDSNPYRANFLVSDLVLNTNEDKDIKINLEFNNPSEGLVEYNITKAPQSGVLLGSFPEVSYQPNNNFNGTDTIWLYLSQGDISSDQISITINVHSENDNPIISGDPVTDIIAYENYSFTPTVSDVDNSKLEFSITNKPSWLNFSSSTGELAGTPTNEDAATYSEIMLSVTDGVSASLLPLFNVTVKQTPWIPLTGMPVADVQGATAVYDDLIYYFGGLSGGMTSVYAYEPLTDTWSSKAPMPVPIHDLSAHTIGNKIYVIAGYGEGGFRNETLEYDPIADSWATKTPKPTYRYVFSSAEVNGLIYVIGGHGTVDDGPSRGGIGWAYKNYVEIYNPETDNWTNGQPAPTTLSNAASCVVNEKIYILGGSTETLSTSVYSYDPELNHWSMFANLPSARQGSECEVIGQSMYLFGGRAKKDNGESLGLTLVESYNLQEESWYSHTEMTLYRSAFRTKVHNEHVYIFGGNSSYAGKLNTVEKYAPEIDM